MKAGCYTALITPFKNGDVDWQGFEKLLDFQLANNITGLLAVGTTGESPTLTWDEHNKVIETTAKKTKNLSYCIAGTGSNNTAEAMTATEHAAKAGVNAVLLVEPYYNGPSSLEIRREYMAPIAKAYPNLEVIPYVIPGRTGTQILAQDLAIMHRDFKNVHTVKEASGDMANIKKIRKACGDNYEIFSGEDSITFDMIIDADIKCIGAISVISNIAPLACAQMVEFAMHGKVEEARAINQKLMPLFDLVTFKTAENTAFGDVMCKARNPLPIKAMFHIMGVYDGFCRQPLGKLSRQAGKVLLDTLRKVNIEAPEIFAPLGQFYGVDVAKQLANDNVLNEICYDSYE